MSSKSQGLAPGSAFAWLALSVALACSGKDEPRTPGGAAGSSADAGRAGNSGSAGRDAGAGGRDAAAGSAGRTGTAGSSGAASGSAGALGRAGGGGSPSVGGSAGMSAAGAPTAGTDAGEAGSDAGGSGDGSYWKPDAGPHRWQWQLSTALGEPLDVDVYDIDWEAPASSVERLHAQGSFVICYVSVGSWEDFRPDAEDFPEAVIGNDYDGWPGEKYVDIRAEALRAIMLQRFDVCRDKGFDAIEPDNMDVFELGSESGFPLTRADGIAYARFLADAAHARGLGIGQKNAASITADIAADYEWALTESCYSDGAWCDDVAAYVLAGKPVFMCEYEASTFEDACSYASARGYSAILKNLDLDAEVTFCP